MARRRAVLSAIVALASVVTTVPAGGSERQVADAASLCDEGSCRPQTGWHCYPPGVIMPILNECEVGTEFCGPNWP